MPNADVVVIGGGLMGCSTALYLAEAGAGNVTVVEKSILGSGSSGRSSAILRCHYGHPELVRMALASLQVFQNFGDVIGGECGYSRIGYMVLAEDDNREALASNVKMQSELGVDVSLIDLDTVGDLLPGAYLDDVRIACYEKDSGYADPGLTMTSLVQRGQALGVQYLQSTEVIGVENNGSRVTGVRTTAGEISTPVVVDCAGPWARRVAAMGGFELPIIAHRAQVLMVEQPAEAAREHPVVSDLIQLQYLRPETGGLTLIGNSDHSEVEIVDPDAFNEEVDDEYLLLALDKATARFPEIENSLLRRGYCGCYEVTPDYQPVIGQLSHLKGFYVNAGYSGHGFKLTPVAGQIMAELIMSDQVKDYDVELFSPYRFAEGRMIRPLYPYQRGQYLR